MIRILIAATLLSVATAPAFACSYNSTANEAKPSTVASQPTDDQGAPPPVTATDKKPS